MLSNVSQITEAHLIRVSLRTLDEHKECGRKRRKDYMVCLHSLGWKFTFDRMISLGIPESVADFIEGWVPKGVDAKHHVVLVGQADEFYGRYAEYLTTL